MTVTPERVEEIRGHYNHRSAATRMSKDHVRDLLAAYDQERARADGLQAQIDDHYIPRTVAAENALDAEHGKLGARIGDERAKRLEYENAVTWHTSCLSCARVLDSANRERERAERAEDRLAQVENLHTSDGAASPFCNGCDYGYPCPTVRALRPATELPTTMTEPVTFDTSTGERLQQVKLVPVDEATDTWDDADDVHHEGIEGHDGGVPCICRLRPETEKR